MSDATSATAPHLREAVELAKAKAANDRNALLAVLEAAEQIDDALAIIDHALGVLARGGH